MYPEPYHKIWPSCEALRARSEPPRPQPNIAVALALALAGWPVFPCAPDKRPLIPGGRNAATTDERLIREWFARWPNALASIPTGPESGLWVLDIDGKAGRRSLNELLAKLGLEHVADLSRVIVRTPSGGLHIYFRLGARETPRTRSSDIAPGLDTRGIGGSIMAPGNVLPDGRRYELIDGADLVAVGNAA
jgi:putative DNA primase/helicase